MIPYAYEIKMQHLGVNPETLRDHGAVSEETIREMASWYEQNSKPILVLLPAELRVPGELHRKNPLARFGSHIPISNRPSLKNFNSRKTEWSIFKLPRMLH
jgi:hypothetical protein